MAKKDNGGGGATTATAASAEASTSSALAIPKESAELAQLLEGIDVGDGGLGEIDQSDIKLPAKVFNMKGTDANGDPIPANVFFDTVEETTKKTLDLAFITLHKTNEWREFDEAKKESTIRCRSGDQVVGIMDNGTERRCEGCPDAKWRTENGKRTRRCGPVYNVIAMERDTQQPCVIRFKKTSLPVIQGHLQKHHLGKLIVGPGKRANVPLFSYAVFARLEMRDGGKYAVPVLERGVAPLSQAEITSHAASAKFYREHVLAIVEKIADKDQDTQAAAADDTSFDYGANAGGGGGGSRGGSDRFVDDSDRMR